MVRKRSIKVVGLVFCFLLISLVSFQFVRGDGTNLTPFPYGWVTDYPYGNSIPWGNCIQETNSIYKYNRQYTLKVIPSQGTIGVDSSPGFDYLLVYLVPGDHVVMRCWIKTSGFYSGDWAGARMGCDFFDDNNLDLCGSYMCSSFGFTKPFAVPNAVTTGVSSDGYVHFGQDWTQVIWDFVVPVGVPADNSNTNNYGSSFPYYDGESVAPFACVPWVQVWGSGYPNNVFTCWFSGMEVYVNPSGSPNPFPTLNPSPTATPTSGPISGPRSNPTLIPNPSGFPYAAPVNYDAVYVAILSLFAVVVGSAFLKRFDGL